MKSKTVREPIAWRDSGRRTVNPIFSRRGKSAPIVKRVTEPAADLREDQLFRIMSSASQEDGVWNIAAFDLPVVVFGETFEIAQANFDEAIKVHFWGLHELGKVKSTIKHLQNLAKEREFYADRLKKSTVGTPPVGIAQGTGWSRAMTYEHRYAGLKPKE